jgi:hypothetical protein
MKWQTAMVMYYQEVDEHRREAVQMGEKWMVNTIKALWEHSCSLWMSRNEFVHGKDEAMKCTMSETQEKVGSGCGQSI